MAREREGLPGLGCGMDSIELGVHPDDRHLPHVFASDGAPVWGGRGVLVFGHFCAVSLREHGLLLGQEGVREHPADVQERFEHSFLGLVRHRPVYRPPDRDVPDRQG